MNEVIDQVFDGRVQQPLLCYASHFRLHLPAPTLKDVEAVMLGKEKIIAAAPVAHGQSFLLERDGITVSLA